MTASSVLTPDQLAEFDREGLLRITGLLSAERVRRAREYVLERLAAVGLWRDGAWRFGTSRQDNLKASRVISNKHPDIEALLNEPTLLAVVEALVDGHGFDRVIFKRPQVLFSAPTAGAWRVPTAWHVDGPRLASGRRPGVQLFTFLDTVETRGGGTLAVAGSHRLFNEGRVIRAKELRRLLLREPFFRELYRHDDHASLMDRAGAVGDITLRVVEMTGEPGDAYMIDLRLLHAAAPNAAARPRIMATHRFWRADMVEELAQAYGWR